MVVMGVIVTAVVALAADYPLGRPRPWHRLGDSRDPHPRSPYPPATSSSIASAAPTGDSTPATPTGSLAHTGADTTWWIARGAGLLVLTLASLCWAFSRRRW